jgi:hypothetical protein
VVAVCFVFGVEVETRLTNAISAEFGCLFCAAVVLLTKLAKLFTLSVASRVVMAGAAVHHSGVLPIENESPSLSRRVLLQPQFIAIGLDAFCLLG